jgi:hypothetical protein
LCSAAVIVDVALKMSMITTTEPFVLYKWSKAGERQTSRTGFAKARTIKGCKIIRIAGNKKPRISSGAIFNNGLD